MAPGRLAFKIAYDGRQFYGHQRQPDARTVEGECLRALGLARILESPEEAFFRSASRTDRGVSAIGNVIAFDSALSADAALGAFNDRARDVWAWAVAEVPRLFHPRHAIERWYRYHIYDGYSVDALRAAGKLFEGEHDLSSFTSDPPRGVHRIHSVEVQVAGDLRLVDVRAPSFRRGMVRRIVAAMIAVARGDVTPDEIRSALRGEKRDFGSASPEPLFLMDVSYEVPFRGAPKPKVVSEWRAAKVEADLRLRFLDELGTAARIAPRI